MWFEETSLDFSLLKTDEQQKIGLLATSSKDFFEKYVKPEKREQLKGDLLQIISTTEDYIDNLVEIIFKYFKEDFKEEKEVEYLSKADTLTILTKTKEEILSQCISQFNKQTSDVIKEIGNVTKELDNVKKNVEQNSNSIKEIIETIQRLAESFNQLREFVKVNTENQQHSAPVVPAVSKQQVENHQSVGFVQKTPPPLPQGVKKIEYKFDKKSDVQIQPNNIIHFRKKIDAQVFIDYVVFDRISFTFLVKNYDPREGDLRFGVVLEEFNDLISKEKFEYSNGGFISWKRNTEKCDTISQNDVIRIDLYCPENLAFIFKNDKQLPFRIINIPVPCKIYVAANGVGTVIEILEFYEIKQNSPVNREITFKDIDLKK